MESHEVIGATVAVYPLHTGSTGAIGRAIEAIRSTGVEVEVGPMSTMLIGSADDVFRALQQAYEEAAAMGHVVLQATVSNACPLPSHPPHNDAAHPER